MIQDSAFTLNLKPQARDNADGGGVSGHAVVWMAGAALHPFLRREASGKAGDGGALQCLLQRHRRQQARKALREHGFARSRWADEQYAIAD